jgi:hypothetical protein
MKRRYPAALLGAASIFAFAVSADAATVFPPKLFLSADGVALSSFPSRNTLDQKLVVARTQGKVPVTWTAASDQPWLTVTASGTTGQALKLHANPHGLAKDQPFLANVTVSTSDADFADTETLRVGFWVGSTDPTTVMHRLRQTATSIAANPVEPVVYMTDGRGSVQAYNVYSGAPAATLNNIAPAITTLDVSSDGRTLFALNANTNKLAAVDLATGAVLHRYAIKSSNYGSGMAYARPFGQPALFTAAGPVIAYPSGDVLATGPAGGDAVAATPDGSKIFRVTLGDSPGTLSAYSAGLSNGELTLTRTGSTYINGENCQDLAVSHSGAHVYPACGAPYEFDVYSGKTLTQVQTLAATDYPISIEVDAFDRVVGGINNTDAATDAYVYNQRGDSLGGVPNTGIDEQPGLLKVSGDGTRVLTAMQTWGNLPYLVFRSMP